MFGRSWKRMSTEEEEDIEDDDDEEEATTAPLLGSREDRKALQETLRRFRKDDLADESEELVAAVRMQIHAVANFRRYVNIISTLGLWLLFQPREDSSSLLLTNKGRIICYGKAQEAQPHAVRAYLVNIICFFLGLFVVLAVAWNWVLQLDPHVYTHRVSIAFALALIPVLVLYCWAQRPRRDCGSSFRQHFDASEMCTGSYIRVDEGRTLMQFCVRRRLGHLQLCFSRKYPGPDLLAERLPPGSPDAGCLTPVTEIPAATAGESPAVQKETVEREGGYDSKVLTRIAAALAVLGIIGAVYDYSTFLDKVRIDRSICLQKIHGCSWRKENSRRLGKIKRAAGAFPPMDYNEGGCNVYGDYCDYFLSPTDHCTEKGEAFTNDLTSAHLKIECKTLSELAANVQRQAVANPAGDVTTQYLLKKDITMWSLPLDKSDSWNKISLFKGMRLLHIGPEGSEENKRLQDGEALDTAALMSRCQGPYLGHVDVVLVETNLLSPMFEEDCEDLQEACDAEGFGPETNGYWPPIRMLDHSFQKTLCLYHPQKLPFWSKKVWAVQEQGQKGYTCRGEPRAKLNLPAAQLSISKRVQVCQSACEKEDWCNHVFYSGEMPHFYDFKISEDLTENASIFPDSHFQCWLYESCPRVKHAATKDAFEPITCGQPCGENGERCLMVRQVFQRKDAARLFGGAQGCREICLNATQDLAQCNGFAYSAVGSGTCWIYGPDALEKPYDGWTDLKANLLGAVGSTSEQACFIRTFESFGKLRDRQETGGPGILLRYTDQTSCGGCFERTFYHWIKEPSAFCMVMSHLLTLFAIAYVARKVHAGVQLGKAAFTGKPIVHMTILQDAANTEDFEMKERGLTTFLSKCHQVAEACRRKQGKHFVPESASGDVDCWEREGQDPSVVPVEHDSYEQYDLSNKRRTNCFVDKKLLGLAPEESILKAWSDTRRRGVITLVVRFIVYFAAVLIIWWLLPQEWTHFLSMTGARTFFFIVVPAMRLMHEYVEVRREVQSIVAVTSWGRLVQLTRRPPPMFFPAALCPVWYGGTSIRLDSYQVGSISFAQLDMPGRPLLEDLIRSGFSRPWRRGMVTIRGQFGLLQVSRQEGEALDLYQALDVLARTSAKVEGLQPVGKGGAEVCGICPLRDIMLEDEYHVWEHRLDSFGFFGDPFNYNCLLTLTNRRIIVSRARCPKAPSLVGCLLGPRTCGDHCMPCQEHWGFNPYVTVTSVWYGRLRSYATSRIRLPPFWPGCMPPVMSLSVVFLEEWMQSYPASLQVTQRPYGIPQKVRVEKSADIKAVSVQTLGKEPALRILSSSQSSVPRGHIVVEVRDPAGQKVDLCDPNWAAVGGVAVPPGSRLTLEAGDPEWDGFADEPWLHQLRSILDKVLGRAEPPEHVWEELTEPPGPDPPGLGSRLMARLVGAHMLGHHFRAELGSDDDGADATGSDDS